MAPKDFNTKELDKEFYSNKKNYMKCCDFISATAIPVEDVCVKEYHQLTVFLNPAIKTFLAPRLNYYFLVSAAAQLVKGERRYVFARAYNKQSRRSEYAIFCDRNYKKIDPAEYCRKSIGFDYD
ncbi:MAG: hypothetical protein KAS32_14395 [Candidatus Peribacteraceae bacterium]|nr:hypothetical protein [Candidatus Peribacteraceae bacterium]